MGVAETIALLTLSGAGVTALWRIAFVTGRFEGRITKSLEGLQLWIQNHEDRIRGLEHE